MLSKLLKLPIDFNLPQAFKLTPTFELPLVVSWSWQFKLKLLAIQHTKNQILLSKLLKLPIDFNLPQAFKLTPTFELPLALAGVGNSS